MRTHLLPVFILSCSSNILYPITRPFFSSTDTNTFMHKRHIKNPIAFVNNSIECTSRENFEVMLKEINKTTENVIFLDNVENALNNKIENIEQIHNSGIDKNALYRGYYAFIATAILVYILPQTTHKHCAHNKLNEHVHPNMGRIIIESVIALYGCKKFYEGFRPQNEYKHLEKCKDFLAITQKIQPEKS